MKHVDEADMIIISSIAMALTRAESQTELHGYVDYDVTSTYPFYG